MKTLTVTSMQLAFQRAGIKLRRTKRSWPAKRKGTVGFRIDVARGEVVSAV